MYIKLKVSASKEHHQSGYGEFIQQENKSTKPYILHVRYQLYIFVTEIDSSIN
jgi:hypothetical protein